MLALTRKIGERIVIGNDIIVTIVSVKGDSVKITIDAPKEVKIYRGEIYDAIAEENRQASMPLDLSDLTKLKVLKEDL